MKSINRIGWIAVFVVIVLLFCVWQIGVNPFIWASVSDPPLPPIVQVQMMSDLATTRVQISDFIEGENNHYQARWDLRGEAVLGVDLSKAKYASINEKSRTAAIILPAPHLISSKVDHERSKELFLKSKTIIPVGIEGARSLREEVWKHADKKFQRLAQNEGYLEATRVQAERVLNRLFTDLGWTITYKWEDQ